jgi:hypothetical protein
MAKAIAGAHGGSITVRSEPEGWTTFELRLGRLEPEVRPPVANGLPRRPDERAMTGG